MAQTLPVAAVALEPTEAATPSETQSATSESAEASTLREAQAVVSGETQSVTPEPAEASSLIETQSVTPEPEEAITPREAQSGVSGGAHSATPVIDPAGPRLVPLPDGIAVWKTCEDGLELAKFQASRLDGRDLEIILLRIDSSKFDFVLHSATEEGERPSSLTEWAERHDLVAAINAGMYLPDGLTNTGFLKIGKHLNNSRIVGAFGAFFLTGPDSANLPGAMLLDRTVDGWEALLPRYSMVVQNYRFISAGRRLLWQPGGPEHSVSAVGRDGAGRIVFIHSREPVAGIDLGRLLLEMPVDIRLVMYVEGGSQAGLLLRTPEVSQIWMGRHPADFWTSGNTNAPLPNVIGVKRKERREDR